MKNLSAILILFLMISCAEKPLDVNEAKKVAEDLIVQIDDLNYEAVEKLYSDAFNASESMELKKVKLNQLRDILGEVKAFEFVSSTAVAEFGQPKQMLLEYRVHHAKVTTIEKFAVVEGEGGYRIGAHSVETEGLK